MIGFWDFKLSGAPPLLSFGVRPHQSAAIERTVLMFHTNPPLNALDDFALIASQTYNFGDRASWFLGFRLAISGMLARRAGAERHYRMLTDWVASVPLRDHEHELAVCLFCMDSAVECWVFSNSRS
jgi:hypothetical protein